ncbi:vitamin K epoxide reductase family protein [Mucilaginibacter psychrotolerans]|uniref:Vitamin K epoxide reductase n=1 Tax=Mucilaginibacter psychrotolerans TaxID=1524096 RepID=A0A4Y8SEK6_9SPHI|nr:vitamin K epoxide reductase family protein [Mucilaginibacter psychrotolerans]TFF37318.1 vitamin K epoxide reductase [Mucilaginibacter psychrotolerans]
MQSILKRLFEPKSNPFEAALLISKLLDVKISATTLKKEIEEHPDFPSLLSISDVFTTYGIENEGVKIELDKFADIPCPYIAQLKGVKHRDSFFSVVKSFDLTQVTFFDPEKSQWCVSQKEKFLERCVGIVLLAEAGPRSGERGYAQIRTRERRKQLFQFLTLSFIPALAILTGVLAFMTDGIGAMFPFLFTILVVAGIAVSSLLLWYEVDQHNPFLQQICSSGKKTNCSAILKSKASHVMGISWSVLGFSYFAGMFLLLFFGGITNSVTESVCAWISGFASVYIVFSVYYQWRIAKQWCLLCLSIQAILGLQLITAIAGGWYGMFHSSNLSLDWIIKAMVSFAISFFTINFFLPALKKAKEANRLNTQLQRLKHNPEIFEALLSKQKYLSVSTAGLGITIGNPDAKNTLIKVCAPYCGPCSKAHPLIEDLLDNNSDVKLQIIFNSYGHGYDTGAIPAKHLLAIAESGNELMIRHALDDWYLPEEKNYEKFAVKYPLNGAVERQVSKINAMRDWCDQTDITSTPTFFINGRELPDKYTVADLKYFLSV